MTGPGHKRPSESEQLWIILRVNMSPTRGEFDPANHISGTKAFRERDKAEREAERLNELNGPKGYRYVVVIARRREE